MNKKLRIEILKNYHTQANFSVAVGERESDVSRVIHGRRHLPEEKQRKWANALGVQPEEIFEGAQS